MKRKGFIFFQVIVCAFILLQSNRVFCAGPSEEFPPAQFTFPAPDSSEVQKYLGLKTMEPFKVSDIKAKLVVIEFFSAVCPHCLANAPIINNIYKTIQGNSRLADVKVIAIASAMKKPRWMLTRRSSRHLFRSCSTRISQFPSPWKVCQPQRP